MTADLESHSRVLPLHINAECVSFQYFLPTSPLGPGNRSHLTTTSTPIKTNTIRSPMMYTATHFSPSDYELSTMIDEPNCAMGDFYLTPSNNGDHSTRFGQAAMIHPTQQYSPNLYTISGPCPLQTLEPQMMFLSHGPMGWKDFPIHYRQDYDNAISGQNMPSSRPLSTCSLPISTCRAEHEIGRTCKPTVATTSPPLELGDSDSAMDKPYARLIYEALMQAPDHRMMLREIYDWFVHNTTKPQESGSNGWQNSIRHNLSMNQAFENDKSEQHSHGQSKKANSVWYLTDNAIANGVQSTTRYRKQGPSKRYCHSHIPNSPRQKSGAKGGRATKRTAMLRQQGRDNRQGVKDHLSGFDLLQYCSDADASPRDYGSATSYRPATPSNASDMDNGIPQCSPVQSSSLSEKEAFDQNGQTELSDCYLQTTSDELSLLERDPASLLRMFD